MSVTSVLPELRGLVAFGQPARQIEAAMQLVLVGFSGKNRYGDKEPMAVHSLRVGLQLQRFGDDLTTVLGGFCHDLVEDTDVTRTHVVELFGDKVCDLVMACTLDPELEKVDDRQANLDLIRRVAVHGANAVAVKIVDCTDNMATIRQVPNKWHHEMFWCADQWLALGHQVLGGSSPHVQALQTMLVRMGR